MGTSEEESRMEAGSAGGEAHRDVREATLALLEKQKQRAADAVRGVADAFRGATQSLQGDTKIAGYVAEAADRLDALSAGVREASVAELVAEVETVARRSPGLFVLGAAALGFVVGRLVSSAGASGRRIEARRPVRDERSEAA
jgi:hypothetical protein